MYEGDRLFEAMEYDHIFDVDLGDGVMRKLPFNNGGNYYEAADKFVIREGLSKLMVEQIIAFLKQNALNFKTKEDHERKKPGQAAAGGAFGSAQRQKKSIIPLKTTLYFDQVASLEAVKNKIKEFNGELRVLSDEQLGVLDQLFELVQNKAQYNQTKISKRGFEVVSLLLQFPSDKAFPALDLYRMLLMHPSMSEPFKLGEFAAEILGHLTSHLKNGPMATQMMAIRCLVNMFKNNSSQAALFNVFKGLVDLAAPLLLDANKNVRLSLYTLFINFSITLIDRKDSNQKLHIL